MTVLRFSPYPGTRCVIQKPFVAKLAATDCQKMIIVPPPPPPPSLGFTTLLKIEPKV